MGTGRPNRHEPVLPSEHPVHDKKRKNDKENQVHTLIRGLCECDIYTFSWGTFMIEDSGITRASHGAVVFTF